MEKMDENTSFLFFLTSSRSLSASASSDTALSLSLRSLSHKVRIDSRSFTTWNHCCSNSSYWETHWWDCHCFCHWKEQIVFFLWIFWSYHHNVFRHLRGFFTVWILRMKKLSTDIVWLSPCPCEIVIVFVTQMNRLWFFFCEFFGRITIMCSEIWEAFLQCGFQERKKLSTDIFDSDLALICTQTDSIQSLSFAQIYEFYIINTTIKATMHFFLP